MITLATWLPQIIGYCQFVADDSAVEKAWVDEDLSNTSVTNFDELYEQIFDDLDSDNFNLELAGLDESLVQSIKRFLFSLHQFDAMTSGPNSTQMRDLIASTRWADLKSTALEVLASARQSPKYFPATGSLSSSG